MPGLARSRFMRIFTGFSRQLLMQTKELPEVMDFEVLHGTQN
jgi:hypothetical protein